jgi:formylglycine-generating enzyme required for sulfatase activity
VTRSTAALVGLGVALAGALIALVVIVARSRAEPPARCAEGMIALAARCCGDGQTLCGSQCAGTPRRCAPGMSVTPEGCVAPPRIVRIDGGTLRIGPGDWEAQGVITPRDAILPPFAIDAFEVNEGRYAECIAARACNPIALEGEPGRAIASVTLDEAERFCAWSGGTLPTADQLGFAAAGQSGRRYPWGDTGVVCRRAAWGLAGGPCGQGAAGPELTGAHPDGASPDGVHDLAGNVTEWARPEPHMPPSVAQVRGGSWADSAASTMRSWHFRELPVTTRSAEVGFRCVYGVIPQDAKGMP